MQRPCGYKTKLLFCIESFSSSAHLQWFEGYIATHQSGIPLAQKHGCALHAQKCSSWGWEGCRTHKALEDCRGGKALKLMMCKLCLGCVWPADMDQGSLWRLQSPQSVWPSEAGGFLALFNLVAEVWSLGKELFFVLTTTVFLW